MNRAFTDCAGRTMALSGLLILLSAGCELYNRPDITSDGKIIVMSLNEKGGFKTDETSELYAFDTEALRLRRLTVDQVSEGWVDISPDNEGLLFGCGRFPAIYSMSLDSDGKPGKLPAVLPFGRSEGGNLNAFPFCYRYFPIFVDNETVFHARLNILSEGRFEVICNLFSLPSDSGPNEEMVLEELVRIPWIEKDGSYHTFSINTIPAFSTNSMYYAMANMYKLDIAETTLEEGGEDKKGKIEKKEGPRVALNVLLYSVDLKTKKQREVTTFSFIGESPDSMPIGWMDMALSPDEKRMICCFLPRGGFDLSAFSDKGMSLVYLVDLESGEKELLSDDMNVYYPQWAPTQGYKKTISEEARYEKKAYMRGTMSFAERMGVGQEKEVVIELSPAGNAKGEVTVVVEFGPALQIARVKPDDGRISDGSISWTSPAKKSVMSFTVRPQETGEHDIKVRCGSPNQEPELLLEAKIVAEETVREPEPQFLYLSGQGLADGRSVWISDLEGNRKEVASLPGKAMTAYTGWVWLDPEKVLIYHISDHGIVLVETDRTGSKKTTRYLSHDDLCNLKAVADMEAMVALFGDQRDRMLKEFRAYGLDERTEAAVKRSIEESLGPLKKTYEGFKAKIGKIAYSDTYPLPKREKLPEEKPSPAIVPEGPAKAKKEED